MNDFTFRDASKGDLDTYDQKILAVLAEHGRISITALAKEIGLSKTPCQVRVRKLEDAGFIRGYRAVLDPGKLGLGHVSFVEVRLSDTRESALSAFNTAVQAVPEIEQCHMIAGAFDYLLKVRSQGIDAYRRVLGEVISALPHVASTSTYVSMEAVKDSSDMG